MGRALMTASGLDRAMTCLASLVLPQEPQSDNVYSIRGTRSHAALEVATLGARMEDIRARGPEDMGQAEMVSLLEAWAALRATQRLLPVDGFPLCEVTLGLTATEGLVRVLGAGLGRRYDAGPGEIVGTADYVFRRDGVLTVLDVKTGNPKYGKQARETWQLRMLGVALWLWHDSPPAGVNLALWYPREPGWRMHWASPAELSGWLDNLATWTLVAGRTLSGEMDARPVKSKECGYCASKPHCPLWRKS